MCWRVVVSCRGLREERLVRQGEYKSARQRQRDEHILAECTLDLTGLVNQD